MQRTEVTWAQWKLVWTWARENGYGLESTGGGKSDDHPVHSINWYDAVKWCNALSEMEGRTPTYYEEKSLKTVYRQGRRDLSSECVDWQSSGYRLPTEAEWEKAARAGAVQSRFVWGNEISHKLANYKASFEFSYEKSESEGHHPRYANGDRPFTSPVGSFLPSGNGVYDMSGNVWEWCWDWYDPDWYQDPKSIQPDTPGSTMAGEYRVMRGGGWSSEPRNLRCAVRDHGRMAEGSTDRGFRLVTRGFLSPNCCE